MEAVETFHKLEQNNSKIWKYKQIWKGPNQKIFLTTGSFPLGFLLKTSSRIPVEVWGLTCPQEKTTKIWNTKNNIITSTNTNTIILVVSESGDKLDQIRS